MGVGLPDADCAGAAGWESDEPRSRRHVGFRRRATAGHQTISNRSLPLHLIVTEAGCAVNPVDVSPQRQNCPDDHHPRGCFRGCRPVEPSELHLAIRADPEKKISRVFTDTAGTAEFRRITSASQHGSPSQTATGLLFQLSGVVPHGCTLAQAATTANRNGQDGQPSGEPQDRGGCQRAYKPAVLNRSCGERRLNSACGLVLAVCRSPHRIPLPHRRLPASAARLNANLVPADCSPPQLPRPRSVSSPCVFSTGPSVDGSHGCSPLSEDGSPFRLTLDSQTRPPRLHSEVLLRADLAKGATRQ